MNQLINLLSRSALTALAATALLALCFGDAAAASTPVTPLAWGSNSAGQLGYQNPRTNFFPHPVLGVGPGSGVVAIAAGGSHSLALKANGAVLAWGNNGNGQLGDGTTTPKITPVQVSGLGPGSGVVAIAAGNTHSLALKSDGTVLAWGANANGQLGDGTTTQRTTPVQVSGLGPGSGVVAIAAGDAHSVLMKFDGSALAFGSNANGQLGDGSTTQRTTPVQVSGLGPGSGVGAIAAGTGYSLAVKSDGSVLAWGRNANGQLGEGTTTQRNTPVQVTGLGPGSGVIAVSAGNGHVLALKSNGTVLAWGRNPTAQIGDGTTIQRNTPVQVTGLGPSSGVVATAAGESHSLALKSNSTSVLSWGNNVNGQLGDGTTSISSTPLEVIDPSSPAGLLRGVVAIATSSASFHSLALKSDGTVLSWGNNANGQLGDGNIDAKLEPLPVAALGGVIAIRGGAQYSLALVVDGTVLAWGANANGQLGDGTTNTRSTPLPVLDPSSPSGVLSGVVAITAGAAYCFAVKSDGTVLAWGGNPTGQLGDGTTTNRFTPVQVTGLGPGSGVVAIAAGNGFTLAAKSDGTVLAWGNNANGQLGDGTTTQRNTPVQVTGLAAGSGVIAIAAGFSHSLAVKSDGTVLAWGNNANGQLGDGNTIQRNTPVQVSGLGPGSGVVTVAGGPGGFHTLALKSDGTVLAWGNNSNGQLGDSTTTQRTTPVPVSGLGTGSGVVAIAAGASHSLALRVDGTVLAWGSNANGQLGDGTLETKLVPVQVSNLGSASGIAAIAAGGSHSLAVPALTTSSGIFYFAQAGGGGGFSTVIFLANPSRTKSVSGSVSFFAANGSPLEGFVDNAVQSFVLPPSGTTTIRTRSQGQVTSGYARVSSSDSVVAIATYSLPDFPSLSVGPSTAPAFAFRAPVLSDHSRGIDVGVAAVNVSNQSVTVLFSLADSSGRSIRSLRTARILESGKQVSETLSELFANLPDNFQGTLTIAALSPLPTQSLVVTVVRFGPGLFNTVPLTALAKGQLRREENVE